jgi:hypothetical protein
VESSQSGDRAATPRARVDIDSHAAAAMIEAQTLGTLNGRNRADEVGNQFRMELIALLLEPSDEHWKVI